MKYLLAGLIALAAVGANAQTFTAFSVSDPIPVATPIITDSVNPHGKKYDVANLLGDRTDMGRGHRAMAVAAADTAGWLALTPAQQGMQIVLLQAEIRPERFAKGSLEIESTSRLRAYVDGVKSGTKDTAQDTLSAQSKLTVPLQMLPEATKSIAIKVLLDTAAAPAIRMAYVPDDEFADVAVALTAQGKRHYELRDMELGCRASGASLSPDGKYLAISYANRLSKDNWRQWTEIVDPATGLVLSPSAPAGAKWMPKGSRLYYTTRGDYGYDVYAVALPSMAQEKIMTGVPTDRFEWSPAEDCIFYYDTDEGEAITSPLRRYRDPDDRIAGNRSRTFLKRFDPATGQTQAIFYGSRQSTLADISPDGKRILALVADYDPTEWPFYFNTLLDIDLATLAADTLALRDPDIQSAAYSPDGKSLWITASPSAFGGIGLNCGSHPIPNTYDAQGYIFDLASRTARPMTRDFNPAIINPGTWNAADGRIYFIAENGFDNSLYQLDPASGAIKQIPQEISYIQNFSIGNDQAQWLAYYGQGANTSGRAYLYNLKNGKLRLMADPWADTADQIEWGASERWCFTASDGTEIEGFVTLPPGFDPAKKYPMIVYYYGGTSPTKHNTYSPYNPQVFASRGYIVYQLNPSGTTGYGQEFSARHVNAWGDYTASDIIEGVKALTAERPYIDADKIGAIGASYGGFMTQYLMALTDIFAAGVAHAGISNVTSYWGEGDWGYSYNALAAAKRYPWTDPDLFTKHGSLFNADKIHTPLLLVHGTADNNVPVGESIQLFNALRILGRPVELITVDGEDHYISDREKRIAWQNSIMAFFARYLQDDPRWWQELYGKE